MTVFLLGIAFFAAGYLLYGTLTARSVAPDDRATPACTLTDGVDYVPMPTWRVYLVQLLNIAGLGPIFGPILGALWGPQVFLWIVFGTLLGGGVHDFLSGAMSMRNGGEGLPDLIGRYLGQPARHVSTFFILGLMLLVGTVFVKGPAMLIVKLVPAAWVGDLFGATALLESEWGGLSVWMWAVMVLVFSYYLLATLLPVDKIIGRIYPWLAVALLVMVVGITGSILTGGLPHLPDPTLANLHPDGTSAWPVIFVTVSCGAVSGFHSTQSPIMARCLRTEHHMKRVFYGAMLGEGFIALVWATAAQGYYEGPAALQAALSDGGPAQVVFDIATSTMGTVGGFLALVGVVVLPITSGDTAFRVARLILGDYIGLDQRVVRNRYLVAVPLFVAAFALNFVDFAVIWQYFGWANQTLAVFALWTGTVFLARREGWWWLMPFFPAVFMTVMTTTFILVVDYGVGLSLGTGTAVGVVVGGLAVAAFAWTQRAHLLR